MLDKNKKLINEALDGKEYTLTILTGRGRDSVGEMETDTFVAENDVAALLYVFKTYNLQSSCIFEDEEEYLEDEDKEKVVKVLEYAKTGDPEGIELLTQIYFDDFDPSDYYDSISTLIDSDGTIIFEDESLEIMDDEDDEDWDDEDFEDENKE